ncbi:GNAT family N-acetyltransferase [Roseibium sp.]|uniref:GNAT family N-acetyltransferase n=1 Tax=Roseibium sp. TaxID=1936156 RepID=UPI003BABF884
MAFAAFQMGRYTFNEGTPSLESYAILRRAVGWDDFDAGRALAGLENSVFAVHAVCDNETVAMGRIVGDGGYLYQVVDVIVLPGHQRRGLATHIAKILVDFIRDNLPDKAYISLIAHHSANSVYERVGFQSVEPASTGMVLKKQ